MKKKRNKPHKKAKASSHPATGSAKVQTPEKPERRAFMARSGQILIGAAVIGGGSVFAVSAVRATAREQDITRIGQGVPTVVQIHDPGCSLCTALQKETRKALKGFDPTELDYVVANIRTNEGGAFALEHGQPHVTLMLMDPDGTPVQILSGPQDRNHLRRVFADFAASYQ